MEDTQGNRSDPSVRRRFEEVFLPHLDAAWNLSRWIMQNDEDAKDCVQEAFLRAYKAFPRFRQGDGRPWLMAIVRNVCYSAIKSARNRRKAEPFDEELHSTGQAAGNSSFAADTEMIDLALGNLEPEFREVIVLHDMEGFSYREIAAVSGIPIGTVMSRLARGREKLRIDLGRLSKGGNP